MPKKPKISQEDIGTFHKAMEGTKPLMQKKIRLTPPPPARKPIRRHAESIHLSFSEAEDLAPVKGEEFIAFKQTGVPNKTLRKLRKGQYNVEAMLDLHGLSVEEAQSAVESFLHECLHEKLHVVLIIHGKGHHSQAPILKNKLNHWLRGMPLILAFCSADASHGNRGAVYILLKRSEGSLLE